MTKATEVYRELLSSTPNAAGRGYRVFGGPDGVSAVAFIDGPSKQPGLELRFGTRTIPRDFQLPLMRGALTSRSFEKTGAEPVTSFEIMAAGREHAEVFTELASRLIVDCCAAQSAGTALQTVLHRLSAWVRFFSARGPEGLSRTAELGLVGELLCLKAVAKHRGLAVAAIAWQGPSGGPHDFVFERGGVEAKLTTSSTPETIHISSTRQLDESVLDYLLLFVVLAQEVPEGTSLAGLVAELRLELSGLDETARSHFEDQLVASGCTDGDLEKARRALHIHRSEFLRVGGDFPRILPRELRTGVGSVRYDVSWAAIAPYRLEADQVETFLNG